MIRLILPLAALISLSACNSPLRDHVMAHLHGTEHRGHQGGAPGGFSMQGNDTKAFFANPNAHAFYDLSVKTFAKGADGIDFPAYQSQSYAIFRALGSSMGVDPAGMQDHLKGIPAQMVQIVKDDPTVLKDYASFTAAMIGPP